MSISKVKSKNLVLASICLILVAVFLIYSQFDFLPTSTDSIRIMIGAEEIKSDGELHTNIYENGGYTPYEREVNYLYPQFQIMIFTLSQISGVDFHIITTLVSILVSVLIFSSFYILVRYVTKSSRLIAITSSLFLFFSLSIGRSVLLTPQNLFGYLFCILGILFLLRYTKDKKWKDLLILIFMTVAMLHFHHLTFFVFLIIAYIYLFLGMKGSKKIWFFFTSLLLASMGFLFLRFVLNQTYLIDEFKNSLIYVKGENANSIFDLPAQVGYILFLLMTWGIFQIKNLCRELRLFILVSTFVIFGLSYLHYLGIYYFPDRMILYFIIPAIFLIPVSINYFAKNFKKPILVFFVSILFIAQLIHYVYFLKSDIEQFTSTFIPTASANEAFRYLNENSSESDTVLTTFYLKNRSSIYLPYYYKGNVTFHQSSNLTTSPLLKEKKYADTYVSRYLRGDGDEQSESELLKNNYHQIFLMIVAPKSNEAQKFYKEYGIKYIMIYKETELYNIFKESGLQMVFENNEIAIFKYE